MEFKKIFGDFDGFQGVSRYFIGFGWILRDFEGFCVVFRDLGL